MLLQCQNGQVKAINRKGITVGMPALIAAQAPQIPGNWILDGESMGNDLLANGENLHGKPLCERLHLLGKLLPAGLSNIRTVPTYYSTRHKRKTLTLLKKCQAEGVVLKRLDASFLVYTANDQRSVAISLHDTKKHHGNVTIPANHKIPATGTVIEVRYLYAFSESEVVFQPVYLGPRTDIHPDEP